MRIQTVQVLDFTGSTLRFFGAEVDATCVVRNEVNGWRSATEVVRTMGSTKPHGLAYQPRRFPPGVWQVTDVVDMPLDTEYWPVWIGTDATQELTVWEVEDGRYVGPTDRMVTGRGYGIHHARYAKSGRMVLSNTTLGCINAIDPDDARWLADEIRAAMSRRLTVCLRVPDWGEWV